MSYFLHAVFRTGKRSIGSRKLSLWGVNFAPRRVRAAKYSGVKKARLCGARQIVPERFIGWKL
jgi:hypothetical protein